MKIHEIEKRLKAAKSKAQELRSLNSVLSYINKKEAERSSTADPEYVKNIEKNIEKLEKYFDEHLK